MLIDNGTGNSRKITDMSSTNLKQLQRQALTGVHAFSGNDYVSRFFRKGKKTFWDVLTKHERFVQIFADLGLFDHVVKETKQELKEFVCLIYVGKKCKSVDKLRAKILHQKFKKETTFELIMLPPCSRNLEFHTGHSNYVANLYSEARQLMMLLDSPLLHGWTANGEPEWTDQCFPDDVRDLLLLPRLDDEVDFDEDSEEDISDEDDDDEEEKL